MKFKELEGKQHDLFPSFDKQWKVEFENGNGLSIINGSGAYCDEDTYEVAPLWKGHLYDHFLDGWGDQVKGYVTEEQIDEILEHAEKDTQEEFEKYLNIIE